MSCRYNIEQAFENGILRITESKRNVPLGGLGYQIANAAIKRLQEQKIESFCWDDPDEPFTFRQVKIALRLNFIDAREGRFQLQQFAKAYGDYFIRQDVLNIALDPDHEHYLDTLADIEDRPAENLRHDLMIFSDNGYLIVTCKELHLVSQEVAEIMEAGS
jgi:hypothetical protein